MEKRKHTFVFNSHNNSGEYLCLLTEYFADGDLGDVFNNQTLSLFCSNSGASLDLSGIPITPKLLRELANQLDEVLAAIS